MKFFEVTVKHLQGLYYAEAMEYLQQFSIKQLKEIAVGLNLILAPNIGRENLKHIIYVKALYLKDRDVLVNYLKKLPDKVVNRIVEKMQIQMHPSDTREEAINSIASKYISEYAKCTCGARMTGCICK